MRQELEGLSEAIDEIARIDEALAENFSRVAGRLEEMGLAHGAAPFREMSHRHAEKAARSRARCARFISRNA